MFKKLFAIVLITSFASLLHAQQSDPDELARRVKALEDKVSQLQQSGSNPQLDEIRHEIDVLTQQIEEMKIERSAKTPSADEQQYGLGGSASKVYRAAQGVSFGGYGEALYQNHDARDDSGVATNARDTADALRAILYTGYKFNDKVIFNSELEVEHASTEDGGEAAMEFAYLDYLYRPQINFRAGLLLEPVGLTNELHEPTAFLAARRPDVEDLILPTTWRDPGFGIFGDAGRFSYRTYVVTGLKSEGFSDEGIGEGKQEGAKALAENFAWVGRVDFHPFEGTMIGGSYYTGGSSQGSTTPSGQRFTGRVSLGDLHADAKFRGVQLRAVWAEGKIGDAAAINETNGLEGDESVGKTFGGWYAEAGYDLGSFLPLRNAALIPFVRYEDYSTQKSVPAGYQRNPALDVNVLTTGIAYKPIPQTVIKLDYQNYDNKAKSGLDQFNIAIGYIF